MGSVKQDQEGEDPSCKNCRKYFINTRGRRDKRDCLGENRTPRTGIRKQCLNDGTYSPQIGYCVNGYDLDGEKVEQELNDGEPLGVGA